MKKLKSAGPNGTAPADAETQWRSRVDAAIGSFEEQKNQASANQAVATLLNEFPEAKDFLKDKDVQEAMMEAAKYIEPNLPSDRILHKLKAAYALATRDKYVEFKLKGAAAKPPAEVEEPGKNPPEKRRGPETLEQILERNLEKLGLTEE